MERRLISSGSPYEPIVGFSRAVRVGAHVYVAGTAPIEPGGAEPPPDTYGQTRRCLETILTALAEAGARPEDVVRTRAFATAAANFDEYARARTVRSSARSARRTRTSSSPGSSTRAGSSSSKRML